MTGLAAKSGALRVVERREFKRLGGRRTIRVDARLVALTKVDLEDTVRRRAFRPDLFYRLNITHIRVRPLRERPADIGPLARAFLKTFAGKHGRPASSVGREAAALLAVYEWPATSGGSRTS